MILMNTTFLSHTEIDDIDDKKLYIDSTQTLQMIHKVFNNHELIFKTPICKLGKYPLQTYKHFNPQNNKINLQFEMGQEYANDKFYQFYTTRLQQFICEKLKGPLVQKIVNNTYKLKLSHMESYDYPVYEVTKSESSYKPWVKIHKPTSKDELETLFKPNYNFVAFIQFKAYHTSAGNYLVMKPIKIYVGKNLDELIINQVIKTWVKQLVPSCDYYDPKQVAHDLNESEIAKLLEC